MTKMQLTWMDEYDRCRAKSVTPEQFDALMDDPNFVNYSENIRLDGVRVI